MGFDEGRIILDSDNGAYYAGQIVHGKVVFDQDKVKTFRGIYACMKGYCFVSWSTTHTRTVNKRTQTYRKHHKAYEVYFELKQYLIGSEDGETSINPGHYEYPFHFQIPADCPSSFEGHTGHIRYEVEVVVDRAFRFDQSKKAAVKVIVPVNLNLNPYCSEPMEFEFDESFCCWCVSSGSCETIVKLPMSGYCPGQVIPFEVSCTNNSGIQMKNIVFSVIKYIEYRAFDCATKHQREVIGKLKKGPVAAHTTRNWTVEMAVPVVDVYNLDACKYISLEYKFNVEIETGACHRNADESRKMIIGSIPLVGFQDNYENPLQDQMPKQPMPVFEERPAPYPNPVPHNQPYQQPTGHPGMNLGDNPPPYPGDIGDTNKPYPGNMPGTYPPYPGGNQAIGFKHDEKPEMPSAAVGPPYPGGTVPYTSPSAPESSTPDTENKPALGEEVEPQPAYNPSVYKK